METMHTRRQAWARHVQAWRGSGLTQVAYCQQHELKPKALAYWIRRSKQTATPLTLVPLALQGPSAAGELLLQHALRAGQRGLGAAANQGIEVDLLEQVALCMAAAEAVGRSRASVDSSVRPSSVDLDGIGIGWTAETLFGRR